MITQPRKTVVVIAGLPYSGKTAIIQQLIKTAYGSAVFVDDVFRGLVSESEVCLVRWLEEGSRLVEGMERAIKDAQTTIVYVEIGILQSRHRKSLSDWIRDQGYREVPILLHCGSKIAVAERQAARAEVLSRGKDRLKIAIDLDELYGPISAAFEPPQENEGYTMIDTSTRIEDNIRDIRALFDAASLRKS